MKSNNSRSNYDKDSQLAYKFAPINYQHVNLANVRRDLVCAIDYDGEWDTSNNRKNLHNFELIPVVYYNILKTRNYYYILYCFYHADDKDHENDLEGCLLIIQRKNEKILGMITIAHWNFYSYSVYDSLKPNQEDIDGKLYLERFEDGNFHPMTRQEPNKHGFYAWRGAPWWMFWEPRDSKKSIGIRYVPANEASMPDENKIESFKQTSCGYVLIDINAPDGFWSHRDDKKTFKSWGVLNSSTSGSANAPWVWDDFDDSIKTGTIFYDPAQIASKYFRGPEQFDKNYEKQHDAD